MILSASEIKPGMVLEQGILAPDSGVCLLSAGISLSISNIEKIRELHINEIRIADRYSVFVSPNDMMTELLVRDYIGILRKICPKRPEANRNDNVVLVAKKLENLIVKVARIDSVLSFLVEQKLISSLYLYEQSLYTSVLSGIIAGCMKLSDEDILCTIVGALLHNIGMCEMPLLIGQSNLSGQQEELFKEHPTYGYYISVQKNIPRKIGDCILKHHENWNGSGFPKGLSGKEIPLSARIISVCSSYASNIICKKTPPYLAIEEIYGMNGIHFDPDVVQEFINNIPVYPLGEIVRLSTKEVGIVSNIRKNDGPRPIVKVYYNRVNREISEDKVIDLGKERTIFIEEVL